MKQCYTSTPAKLIAFFLAVLCTLSASMLSFQSLRCVQLGYLPNHPYEESALYLDSTINYALSAANLYRMRGEATDSLPFLAQQERETLLSQLESLLLAEDTNYRFEIRSANGGESLYFSNFAEGESFSSLSIQPQYATVNGSELYISFDTYKQYYFNADSSALFSNPHYYGISSRIYEKCGIDPSLFEESALAIGSSYATPSSSSAASYIICFGFLPDYPAEDGLAALHSAYSSQCNAFILYLLAAAFCAAIAVASIAFLCCSAAHRKGCDQLVLYLFDYIPFEIILLLFLFLALMAYSIVMEFYNYSGYHTPFVLLGAFFGFLLLLFELCILTTAARIKTHTFWRHTLIGRLTGFCANLFNHLELTWKFAALYIVYEFVSLFLASSTGNTGAFFLLAIPNFIFLLLLCRWAVKFSEVRAGAAELAKGNLEYRISTARLPKTLRAHADDLNHISEGMSAAVDEQMKSERLKSELITNVSHDIKTPLTSIINYVDLIKAEPIDDPKLSEYIAVLDRQSARLKKLTNDLIDASKASSGTLPIHWENVDVCELLQQAVGEYSERFATRDLVPVVSLPDRPVYIRADGALLWRVIDNLLSNICKYALSGTRIYITALHADAALTITFKNISQAQLNIPAEELMERFVRGDSSRNSEGSGLGLSIARSLTQLMGGTFAPEIDGDLFKATVTFPTTAQ